MEEINTLILYSTFFLSWTQMKKNLSEIKFVMISFFKVQFCKKDEIQYN